MPARHRPAGLSSRRAREKLCGHLEDVGAGQTHQLSWRAVIGVESSLGRRYTPPSESFVRRHLTGRCSWFWRTDLFLRVVQCLLRSPLAGGYHTSRGARLRYSLWCAVTGSGLAGSCCRHFPFRVCLVRNRSVIQGRRWETIHLLFRGVCVAPKRAGGRLFGAAFVTPRA